jgi:hypothetical protein
MTSFIEILPSSIKTANSYLGTISGSQSSAAVVINRLFLLNLSDATLADAGTNDKYSQYITLATIGLWMEA